MAILVFRLFTHQRLKKANVRMIIEYDLKIGNFNFAWDCPETRRILLCLKPPESSL